MMDKDEILLIIEVWHKDEHVGLERLTKKGWEWRYFALDPDNGERWCRGVIESGEHTRIIQTKK